MKFVTVGLSRVLLCPVLSAYEASAIGLLQIANVKPSCQCDRS